jgi:hypothetical protein
MLCNALPSLAQWIAGHTGEKHSDRLKWHPIRLICLTTLKDYYESATGIRGTCEE